MLYRLAEIIRITRELWKARITDSEETLGRVSLWQAFQIAMIITKPIPHLSTFIARRKGSDLKEV